LAIRCEVKNISKRFAFQGKSSTRSSAGEDQPRKYLDVLNQVSFQVSKGEFVSIVGPSGCGKSTLLRVIAALERPTTGEVLIDGMRADEPGTNRGFIFQDVGLYPWRNALQNAEFFLELKGVDKQKRRGIAMEKLELVGLSEFVNYYPVQLSGGMQQKVAIARALSIEPSILLMDEPFGSLDALSREKAQVDLLRILSEDRERSVLFVTHDIDEAVFLGDRVLVFSRRPGMIREVIDTKLGDRRWETDIRANPEFGHYCARARSLLKQEAEILP
jgi:NitT/TauT family transport system ATP-binding protein